MVRAGGVHGVDGDLRHGGGRQARQGEGHPAAEVSNSQMHETFCFTFDKLCKSWDPNFERMPKFVVVRRREDFTHLWTH